MVPARLPIPVHRLFQQGNGNFSISVRRQSAVASAPTILASIRLLFVDYEIFAQSSEYFTSGRAGWISFEASPKFRREDESALTCPEAAYSGTTCSFRGVRLHKSILWMRAAFEFCNNTGSKVELLLLGYQAVFRSDSFS